MHIRRATGARGADAHSHRSERDKGTLARLPSARRTDVLPSVDVETFFLDRCEVTNRQFRQFVSAGGYQKREYWPTPVERNGKGVSWEALIGSLRDATGRPGPSTWELGNYPEGEDDHPVGGLGWHEAAAYCAFAGRSLPTIYHWFRAIGSRRIVGESNSTVRAGPWISLRERPLGWRPVIASSAD